jgi:hypothetical protein
MKMEKIKELFSLVPLASKERLEREQSVYSLIKSLSSYSKYFRDMEDIKVVLPETLNVRGADLPYWGEYYFNKNEKGTRTMVIAQDSKSKDAGSIVFYAPLLPLKWDKVTYNEKFYSKLEQKTFPHSSYLQVLDAFDGWGVDLNFLYLTDARKVYGEDGTIDEENSLIFVKNEIKAAKPDRIILLGRDAFTLFGYKKENYRVFVGEKKIEIDGITAVVAPFITGNGRGGTNKELFPIRYENVKNLLKANEKKQMNF